jgi:hypothetical protein
MFMRMRSRNIADAARKHDRLVIPAHFARDHLLKAAKVSA